MSWHDTLNVGVAALAVALSAFAVIRSVRQQQRDAFFRVQEMLLSHDYWNGRRLLAAAARNGSLPADDKDFNAILRAITSFNTVAILVRRRVVPRSWMLDSWHHVLRDMRLGFDSVVEHRRSYRALADGRLADLDALITAAERYRSAAPCCRPSNAPKSLQRPLLPRDGFATELAQKDAVVDAGRETPS